jgi:hypothetical protein
MKFGGLSEIELESIAEILKTENINFSIETDSEITSFNDSSIRNNLRHLTPANLSTHILAISIADEDFEQITDLGKKKLLEFGITNVAPSADEFKSFEGNTILKEMLNGPIKVVGAGFVHQILAGLILLGLGLSIKFYFE